MELDVIALSKEAETSLSSTNAMDARSDSEKALLLGREEHGRQDNVALTITVDHSDADEGVTFSVPSLLQKKENQSADEFENENNDETEDRQYRKKERKYRRRRFYEGNVSTWPRQVNGGRWGVLAQPENVHSTDWRDMVTLTDMNRHHKHELLARKATDAFVDGPFHSSTATPAPLFNQMRFSGSDLSLHRQNWITETFIRRECAKYIPTNKDPDKCGCGRARSAHYDLTSLTTTFLSCRTDYTEKNELGNTDEDEAIKMKPSATTRRTGRTVGERWSIKKHTMCLPTNAFGQIEFQGGPHPYKAQYVRLSFDTDPAHIMSLFEHVWNIQPPKLIITVHGGMSNFELQTKLARVFRKGLLKAAKTTGAWIITSGVDAGVVRHVAAALEGSGSSSRSKIVCIGITPWGLLKKREDLLGKDVVVPYHPHSFHSKSRCTILNNRHSYFLLVDNGTVGRFGADVILRRRLEMYISQKQKIFGGTRSVPVVCVALEGGACTIRTVLDYVTNVPRVPVVVCDGSGRASDLLAFAHQQVQEDGSFRDDIRPQLLHLVQKTFAYDERNAEKIMRELSICAQQKHLMTVFRLGEKGKHDVDYAILTALLKGQNLSAADQLSLALAWNRVDIARSDIFVQEQTWSQAALHNAMMEALIHDRVDFVRLLLEKGVSMQRFLTIARLEELYNTDKGPPNTLYYIVKDVVKIRQGYHYKLTHIGMAIEKLMGNAYKTMYTSSDFKHKYNTFMKKYKAHHRLAAGGNFLTSRSRVGSAALSRQSTEPVLNLASLPTDPALSEPMMAAPSGSRALSNHILWRSAFRNINTLAMRPPNLGDIKEPIIDDEELSITGSSSDNHKSEFEFRYPFSELLLWAVLTKRQEMALCMWQHGEEALAKSLVACRLYKSLAKEAAEDYLEVEICEELKKYAEEFRGLALELLDHCYQADDAQALQLLTYELQEWGHETCLSLAVNVNNKHFLAHPCCQILLADLWHGGLRIRSHSNVKVLMGLVLPFYIQMLDFKTREELLLQPQTAAEHEQDINDSSSSSSSSSSDESSSSSYSDSDDEQTDTHHANRRVSHGSMQSLNQIHLGGLFHRSKKRGGRHRQEDGVPTIEGGLQKSSVTSANNSPPQMRKRVRTASYRNSTSAPAAHAHDKSYGSNGDVHRMSNGAPRIQIEQDEFPSQPNKGFLPDLQLHRMKPIKFRRRFYEFYAAPITTFWSWTLSFCVFLSIFTYVLLVRTPEQPSAWEYFLLAYVISLGMEHTRKFAMSDMEPFSQKLKYFFFNYWNTVTALAVLTFIIGFVMRAFGSIAYGRVVLACNSVLWTMKLLDYMSVHPRLGPYITMAGKMVLNMSYVIVMLVVSLLAFGLARQSITFPNEDWHWLLVRNIFYKPYFMLYGEVYADEIDQCGDDEWFALTPEHAARDPSRGQSSLDSWDVHLGEGTPISQLLGNSTQNHNCVPGYWIPPILMTFFLLVANILLMSMLIAIFNHIFDQTDEIAQQIWLFQRYRQVMEYESTPFLPPPLTVIYHAWMVIKYSRWKIRNWHNKSVDGDGNESKRKMFDFSLKLFLSEDQVEKLHDFEEDCMEDLARQKEHVRNTSNEQRILRTAERTEMMMVRLNDLTTKESSMRESVRELEGRLECIENKQSEILDAVRSITVTLPHILSQLNVQNVGGGGVGRSASPQQLAPPPPHHRADSVDETIPSSDHATAQSDFFVATRRQRTTTISGLEDHILLSPTPLDSLRFGSTTNIPAGSTPTVNKIGTSLRRQRYHNDDYTAITDVIKVAEGRRRAGRDDRGDSDDDNSPTCTRHCSDEGEDLERTGGRIFTVATPPKRSRIPPFSSIQKSTFKEDEEEMSERLREEESLAVDGDCELTELERDNEDYDETEREQAADSEKSASGFDLKVVNELGTPPSPEPHPSPEPRKHVSKSSY